MLNGELYLSVDIEANGRIPGVNSMLSLGAASFTLSSDTYEPTMHDTFYANLDLLEGASSYPPTMQWWAEKQNQAAYNATRTNLESPEVAMKRFVAWVNAVSSKTKCKPVFVAYPAGFDFSWVHWYMIRFTDSSPFSFSALDMKTAAMFVMKCGYREATKRNMPKNWFSKKPHTHNALDDAIEQGELFCSMMKEFWRPE